MFHLGVDIGKQAHYACLIDESGKAIVQPFKFMVDAKGFDKFLSKFREWDKQELSVAFEATGPYWLTFFQCLKNNGFEDVSVLNPLQVASFRNQSIRGTKTDKVDCLLIADILRMGDYVNYRLPDDDIMGLRELSRFRVDLIGQLARIKTKIIGVLDLVFPEYASLFSNVFGASSQTILDMACTPEDVAALDLSKLKALLVKTSRHRIKAEKAVEIKQAAKNSIGVKFCVDAFTLELRSMLDHLKFLETQVKALEKEIRTIFRRQKSHLTTIPGIADTNAATILSEVGDISNFKKQGGRKLVAFAGLDAKITESGRYVGKPKMSKRGSPYLRHAVMQSSFVASMHAPFFKSIYDKQVRRGKSHRVAVSHVANKMIHVIYSVLKNDKPYSAPASA